MHDLSPDQLFLQGRLQIETALDALSATGLNPEAEHQLRTFISIQNSQNSLSDGSESQHGLSIYLRGGETERVKADIIRSLELAERIPTFPHIEAARGLLELLRTK